MPPFKILFSGGDFEMVLDDAEVGVDVTTEHYGGLGLLLVVS